MTDPQTLILLKDINKSFLVGKQSVHILKNVNLEVKKGEFCLILGPSGCGKSTLLHIMLGLEEPSSGSIDFLSKRLYIGETEDDRSQFRKVNIGMVYQQPNWIKSMSVINNVIFPLLLQGLDRISSKTRANEMLKMVEMLPWAEYAPTELSSGQQQRVALARALVTDPEVIIADEPTGNLDFESGQVLMELLKKLNKETDKTIIMVTHDLAYITYATKTIKIFNGEIVGVYGPEDNEALLASSPSKSKSKLIIEEKNNKE